MLKNFIRHYLEKPFRYILGIFLIGLFLGLVYAVLNKAQSDEHMMGYPPGMLSAVPLPLYCGNSMDMLLLTKENFGMLYQGSAEVRRNGITTGDILGTMSFWYNKDTKRGVFYMTLKESQFTCLLSYGVNWSFDTDNMLDIINEEIK